MSLKKSHALIVSLLILSSLNLIISCAPTQKKAEVTKAARANLGSIITDAERKINTAYEQQWDVLAYAELKSCAERADKAKQLYTQGASERRIMRELQEFDVLYKEVQNLAEARAPRVEGLLAVRKRALNSGVRQLPDDRQTLYILDQRFRSISQNRKVDVNDFSRLQDEYIKLSVQTIKYRNLARAEQQIIYAINNKAKRYAPKALNMAELDLENAENMIEVHIDNPKGYATSVEKAKMSAAMLAAIVDEQKKVDYNLDEAAAQKIVQQSGTLRQLSTELESKDEELYYSQEELKAQQKQLETTRKKITQQEKELSLTEKEIKEKEAALALAEKEKRFQEKLTSVQNQFSKDEAEVYRQGDKILIRLKKIEFPFGQSQVPEKSKTLLDKVASVAKQLDPKEIIVEGHTDSIGPVDANNKISRERADSVTDYLESEGISKEILQSMGLGFEKPLSTNRTKTGRAQNRRVDIWITPTPIETKTE